ncbi:hypothetical protein [Leadbettera azotonutricia]|uniref:Putative outer membrane autotransporter barrel n=1 Tax=Leadbettera azotonutricia (strain ATCC BAA-888 / DSM 13862 / ZAS-9) TaxID=545695 RepID=F5Y928_LEAAZ|nr:hypothetical protein [Leadbettera azotonutricia]AEF81789.1 putative outer membrane autotransporter barrel [Leadbettera azotonutricia ZAS-9]
MKTKISLTSRLFGGSPLLAASVLAISLFILICSCDNPAGSRKPGGNNGGSTPPPGGDPDTITASSVATFAALQTALADATKDPITLTAAVSHTSAGSNTLSVGGGLLKVTAIDASAAQVTYPAGTVFTKAAKTVNIGDGNLGFNPDTDLTLSSGLTLISEQTADKLELRLIAGPAAPAGDVLIHNDTGSNDHVVRVGYLYFQANGGINAKGLGKAVFYKNGEIVGTLQGNWRSSNTTTLAPDTNRLIIGGPGTLYAAGDPASITIPAGKTLLIGANTTLDLGGKSDVSQMGSIVLTSSASAPYAKVTLAAASTSKVVTENDTSGGTKTSTGPLYFDIGGNRFELTAGGKVAWTTTNSGFSQFTTTTANASLSAYGTGTYTIAANQPVD